MRAKRLLTSFLAFIMIFTQTVPTIGSADEIGDGINTETLLSDGGLSDNLSQSPATVEMESNDIVEDIVDNENVMPELLTSGYDGLLTSNDGAPEDSDPADGDGEDGEPEDTDVCDITRTADQQVVTVTLVDNARGQIAEYALDDILQGLVDASETQVVTAFSVRVVTRAEIQEAEDGRITYSVAPNVEAFVEDDILCEVQLANEQIQGSFVVDLPVFSEYGFSEGQTVRATNILPDETERVTYPSVWVSDGQLFASLTTSSFNQAIIEAISEEFVATLDGVGYEDLEEAFWDAEADSTIVLLQNASVPGGIDIDISLTLDLNGKVLTSPITSISGANVTITDCGNGAGKLSGRVVIDGGSLTLNAGLIEASGKVAVSASGDCTVTINDGTVAGVNAISLAGNLSKVIVNGGYIAGNNKGSRKGIAILCRDGECKIRGGIVSGEYIGVEAANYGKCEIRGGSVTGGTYGLLMTDDAKVTIAGGEITGSADSGIYANPDPESETASLEIKGGTVTGGTYGLHLISKDAIVTRGTIRSGGTEGASHILVEDGTSLTVNGGNIGLNGDTAECGIENRGYLYIDKGSWTPIISGADYGIRTVSSDNGTDSYNANIHGRIAGIQTTEGYANIHGGTISGDESGVQTTGGRTDIDNATIQGNIGVVQGLNGNTSIHTCRVSGSTIGVQTIGGDISIYDSTIFGSTVAVQVSGGGAYIRGGSIQGEITAVQASGGSIRFLVADVDDEAIDKSANENLMLVSYDPNNGEPIERIITSVGQWVGPERDYRGTPDSRGGISMTNQSVRAVIFQVILL